MKGNRISGFAPLSLFCIFAASKLKHNNYFKILILCPLSNRSEASVLQKKS